MNTTNLAAVSFSGGKDSMLALYEASKSGYNVKYVLNFVSKQYGRCSFHGTRKDLIKEQVKCMGMKLCQKPVSNDMKKYEEEFKSAVNRLKTYGVTHIVFGDIYLEEHKNWVERVCKELNVTPLEPLWGIPPEKVVEKFLSYGFKAIIISCNAKIFGQDFVGREFDYSTIEEIKRKNVCLCGENGEFHTFVYDGPLFEKCIKILEIEKVYKESFWPAWYVEIKKYKIVKKLM